MSGQRTCSDESDEVEGCLLNEDWSNVPRSTVLCRLNGSFEGVVCFTGLSVRENVEGKGMTMELMATFCWLTHDRQGAPLSLVAMYALRTVHSRLDPTRPQR